MEPSDSDDERQYKPNDSMSSRASSGAPGQFIRPVSAREWSKLVSKKEATFYTNDLFTDGQEEHKGGDVLAMEQEPGIPSQLSPSELHATGHHRVAQQTSVALDRRKARLIQGIATSNDSFRQGMPYSPSGRNMSIVETPAPSIPTLPDSNMEGQSTYDRNRFKNLDLTFDPTAENGEGGSYPIPKPVAPEIGDVKTFVHSPGPKTGPLECYIVRDKGSAKMYPRYTLFVDEGKKFLLSARKRKKARTSNYVISIDMEDLTRSTDNYFGKLRSNFVGTEFSVFDNGVKPGKAFAGAELRQEVAAVTYQYNVLGTRGPRRMTAAIPNIDPHTNSKQYQPETAEDSILERIKCARGLDELVVMHNKPPRWNQELNAYCLNFKGRVTEASVKNFQLVSDENQDRVLLQFGKIGKNTFTMDYQWPMTAFQAFAIALSSFDNKLACE